MVRDVALPTRETFWTSPTFPTFADAVAHISYEVKQAAMTAPAALTVAVAATGVLGFLVSRRCGVQQPAYASADHCRLAVLSSMSL